MLSLIMNGAHSGGIRLAPRLVIAGTHSGVGKTTVTTALIAAFTRRGLRVQPFKIGPDFIDPGFHQAASGRVSRNLDGWMLSREANFELFVSASRDADLAVVEGVMGLFDGRSPTSEEGSTAEMAKWLAAPVLVVADASAMARSAAALVHGFETFDSELEIAGILFNRIGGERHAGLLREALQCYCLSKPAGFLPAEEQIALPSRHLGLTLAGEALTAKSLEVMADWVEKHVDLDLLLKLAGRNSHEVNSADIVGSPPAVKQQRPVRIGVARDAAFCFYYQDNLDLLLQNGAELVEFSPITDGELPPRLGGLYLGGGYPEIHAAKLAENRSMREAIRRLAQAGAPLFAECGGFMYLTDAIVDGAGCEYPMAGIFPTRARMQKRLAALTYVEVEAVGETLWLEAGVRLRGHEFRYSEIDPMPAQITRCFRLHTKNGVREEGFQCGSVLAGYAHLHFRSSPDFAARFVKACAQHQSRTL